MKTTKKQEERAGVWMDHHIAHIVSRNNDGDFTISTIDPEELKTISANSKKSTVSEHVRHGKEKQEQKAFFKVLQTAVKNFDHLLLCGPTTAKSEFHHHLKNVRAFTGKRVAEMNAPPMTDRQLLAFMKKNLGKPMDIFREEEVVK